MTSKSDEIVQQVQHDFQSLAVKYPQRRQQSRR
jgi:hypothetical protein